MCPGGSRPGAAFSGPMGRFRRFCVCVSCPRCWSSFCCDFPGFRGFAEVILETCFHLKLGWGFPPGWHEEKAGMCFPTRIFDPSFWRGKAGQVELQMDLADPISFWWRRIGKVRAVRQRGEKPPYANAPRKLWFWEYRCCLFEYVASDEISGSEKVERNPVSGWDGSDAGGIAVMSTDSGNFLFCFGLVSWCSLFKWQTRLTESFRNRGSLRKKHVFWGQVSQHLSNRSLSCKLWHF